MTTQDEEPCHRYISELGEPLITIKITKENLWVIEKREKQTIMARFPLPE
jgi:hypothetical protein